MTPSIFLGLVTHKASRFTEATKDSGLIWSLDRALRALGVETTVVIHDQDCYTPELLDLTPKAVRESIGAELRTEKEWRLYLNPTIPRARLSVEMFARHFYRRLKFAPPWKRTLKADDPGAKMLRRLINIELAHLSVMSAAADSKCQWALILEDDASSEDVGDLGRSLAFFISSRANLHDPCFVNVSRSFDTTGLGIDHLLTQIGYWPGSEKSRLMAAKRPVTNTVCAILYNSEFLSRLIPQMRSIPLDPVIPIDWKLNLALMKLNTLGLVPPESCIMVEPAPIVQTSMLI